MNTNIENKKYAFKYILYKMLLWRNESPIDPDTLISLYFKHPEEYCHDQKIINSTMFAYHQEYPENLLINNKFTQLLPFIVCVASKKRELLNLFNNFYAGKVGIIEKDIDTIAPFEITLEEFVNESRIEEIPYHLIDDAIDILKNKNKNFVHLPGDLLSFYSQRHCSWMTWYNGSNKEIPIEILFKERSVFSADTELLAFS